MKAKYVVGSSVAAAALGAGLWWALRPTALEKGRDLMDQGNLTGAARVFSQALAEKNPSHEEDLRNELGRAYLLKGAVDNAEKVFRDALAKFPQSAFAHLGLGYVQLAKGFDAFAQQSFEQTLALDPQESRASLALGALYANQHNFAQAREAYQKALDATPSDLTLRRALVRLDWSEGLLDQAAGQLEQLVSQFPHDVGNAVALGGVYLEAEKYAEAEKVIRQILGRGKDAMARLLLADILAAQGRLEHARDLYQDVLSDNPNLLAAGLGLAGLEIRLGRLDQARSLAENTASRIPEHPHVLPSYSSFSEIVDSLKFRHNLTRIHVEAELALARLALANNAPQEADRHLNLAMGYDGKDLDVLRLGTEMKSRWGKPQDHLAAAEAGVALYPRHPLALLDRAEALLALKKYPEALADIQAAQQSCASLLRARRLEEQTKKAGSLS